MSFSLFSSVRNVTVAAVVLAVTILGCILSGCANEKVQDPIKTLAQAQAAEKAKDYERAEKLYDTLSRSLPGDERGAKALFDKARIQAMTKKKRMAAYETTRALIRKYSPHGYPVVKQAEIFQRELVKKIDKENSQQIFYKILDSFVALTGRHRFSYWIAIILITVLVKILTWPMQQMQMKGMKQMQQVQPLIKELQKKYKDNQQELGRKVMELYKEHKVNPFASCLPLLIQMPVLWGLYYTIRLYQFQFANGTFLWIGSSLSHLTPLIAKSLADRDIPLVVIYTISMYVTQKLTPVDPTQAEQQKMMSIMMPLMFGYLFGVMYEFPSAFMLYWLVFNLFQIVQQHIALRTPPVEKVAVTPPEPTPVRRPRPRRRRR